MERRKVTLQLILICSLTTPILPLGNESFLHMSPDQIADLRTHCPSTPFCFSNTSSVSTETVHSSNRTSCCSPCSCGADCGLTKNCCFKEHDHYNRGKEDCISTELGMPRMFLRYYVIQSCSDQTDDCHDPTANSWGPLSPVYSPTTYLIYLNTKCALCNGVNDTIPFESNIYCKIGHIVDFSLSEDLEALISGEKTRSCSMIFLPTLDMDVTDLDCRKDIIRDCFVIEDRSTYNISQDVVDLCHAFNATYTVNTQYQTTIRFGNAFCALCNMRRVEMKENVCKRKPHLEKTPFTTVLVGLLTGVERKPKITTNPEVCRSDSLKVEIRERFIPVSTQRRLAVGPTSKQRYNVVLTSGRRCVLSGIDLEICKPLLCPEGQMRVEEDCQFVIELLSDKYAVYVRLTPRHNTPLMPASHFDTLSNDSLQQGHWLLRDRLQPWKPIVYYRLNSEYTHIEFLVIGLYYAVESALSAVLYDVNNAFGTTWVAAFDNERYEYDAKLNRYAEYEHYRGNYFRPRYDRHHCEDFDDENEHLRILYRQKAQQLNSVYLTDYYFCNLVDLLPIEYRTNANGISLKVNNVSLIWSEYRHMGDLDRPMRVRVCAEKWLAKVSKAPESRKNEHFLYLSIALYLILQKVYT